MQEAKLEAATSRLLPSHDMVVEYQNPFASGKLIVPLVLTANVDDEVLERNIKSNSARDNVWLKQSEPNRSVAVLVGSGPSAHDHLELIRDAQANGSVVFALNGAAGWLNRHSITPDFQIIADARPKTAALLAHATNYLFASQVDPSLLDARPGAVLFHADYGGVLDLLPVRKEEFVMVGSHSSVGNTALAVAYALGHREMICVGYDSSHHDGRSHVVHQAINDGEPTIITEFDRRNYVSSLTMRQQADIFPRIANRLIAEGCRISVPGYGLLPDRWNKDINKPLRVREQLKYERMWEKESYRAWSPALDHVASAVMSLDMEPGDSLIDFGCGSGLASQVLADNGMAVTGVDIAGNSLAAPPRGSFNFVQACLWALPALEAKHGLCCDVMEHIPTGMVGTVLDGIARCVQHGCYFTIDSQEDALGAEIGDVLHMTVKPREWWIEKLQERFAVVQIAEPNVYVCWKHEQPAITPDSEKE